MTNRMTILILTLALSFPLRGVSAQEADEPVTIRTIYEEFIAATRSEERGVILNKLARTTPVTTRDLQRLHDLFMRFPNPLVRSSSMASLRKLNPYALHLEPTIIGYLEDFDPEILIFGITAALIVKSPKFTKPIRKIAKGKFPGKDPKELVLRSESNEWLARYQALSALAIMDHDKSFRFIKKRTADAPLVARILGSHYWKKSLPLFVKWSKSRKEDLKTAAREGLQARVDKEALRATRTKMLSLIKSSRSPRDLRHFLSIKIGLSSTEEEVTQLLADYEKTEDSDRRMSLSTSLFASQSRQIIPLLTRLTHTDKDPLVRMGTRRQLQAMLTPKEYVELLDWVKTKDPNPDIRENASDELKRLKKDSKP